MTQTEHGYDVTVHRKKARKRTTNTILYGTDPAICPVRALYAHLAALAAAGRTDPGRSSSVSTAGTGSPRRLPGVAGPSAPWPGG
ncbi:hypothetical protein [Streptomyces sp. NPDC058664]|uniref:hypothetical protein n=1 Tax=unclassified Streptomyces TaxID=2593676 RepID=UPI00365D6954